ncbi:MAG: biotin/lipoyl-binding protein [Chthoniobacterales bacterium]|nr:biotin/lipoyl-binding protein [Chthoniobacterales bacterium]MCX7713581.1 biotin/lipoyl-binding protein [Chthoniobacterales bacterium]
MIKKLRITVDGKVYDVQVETLDESSTQHGTPRPSVTLSSVSPPSSSVRPASASKPSSPGDVLSPLAGRVVSIDCKVGDKVEAGTQLITIEAMKMNTYVNAHCAGTIAAIHVKAGDGVEEGQPLLTIQS